MKEIIYNIISFWKIIIRSSKKFVLIICFDIIVSALAKFPSILLSKRIFDVLSDGGPFREFFLAVLVLVLSALFLNYLDAVINSRVEAEGQILMFQLSISYNLKSTNISYELLSHPSVLEKRELAGKAISGSRFIDMVRMVCSIMSNILVLLGVIVLFLQVDIVIILVVSAVIVVNAVANNLVKKLQYENSVAVTPYTRKIAYINSVCSGLEYGKELRINSFKPLLLKKVRELSDICISYVEKIIRAAARGKKVGHVTNGVQDVVVYGILGMKVLLDKAMSVGDFSMYFNAVSQFTESLTSIISTMTDIRITSLYMGHYLEYMDLPEETQISEETGGKEGSVHAENAIEIQEIMFENVSFSYPGSDSLALKNVSFSVKRGEKLSIVGVNGSGKTTIIKLLLRLYRPTGGRILVNGRDISGMDSNEYFRYFSVVFQDFRLFAFNIRENICGDLNASDSELDEIMKKVDLLDRINSLPRRYETNYSRKFDEKGVEFSGGESQKLAISRALYKDAQIVIMDEPTAALDPLAEYEIYQGFNQLTSGKTAIYISHRLSSCRFCDRIIFLSDGEIREEGSHSDLLKQNGLYADMYSKQAQYYVDETMRA